MNAALRDYWLLWRMALSSHPPRTRWILMAMAALAAATVSFAIGQKTDDPMAAAAIGLRILAAGQVAVWLLPFVPGAVKLNSPANARLVPRMRRRLRQLAMLVWAGATAIATLLALGTIFTPTLVFLATGTWLAASALAHGGHRLGLLLQVAGWLLVVFADAVPDEVLAFLAHGTGFVLAVVSMLVLAACALEAMFMNGGERHYARRTAQALQLERISPQGQVRERGLPRSVAAFYSAALRRDCARRAPGSLLGHLLGPKSHWSARVADIGIAFAGAALAIGLLRLSGGERGQAMLAHAGWLALAGLLFALPFDVARRHARLLSTPGEQALVRLAPGMPGAAPVFNRLLARRLLVDAARHWCMLALCALGLAALAGTSAAQLVQQACLSCLALPLLAANLGDHAHDAAMRGWRLCAGMAASVGVSLVAGMILHRAAGLPLLAGAAMASVAIAALWVRHGWRRSVDAPFAFPVGRLA